MHPSRRLLFQQLQAVANAIRQLGWTHVHAEMTCPEKHARQPGLSQPLSAWKKCHDYDNADGDQKQPLHKSKNGSSDSIQPTQSQGAKGL